MKILAFDSSTSSASVALWEDRTCRAEIVCELGRRHSEKLFSVFSYLLDLQGWEQSDLDAIAVGLGPGSFTGLRVGVATAQGLAFALECPLIGVSSLDALAMGAPAGSALCVSCVDARKQEVYVGMYQTDATHQALKPLRLLKPDVFAEELSQIDGSIVMLGSGALQYKELFSKVLGERLILPAHGGFHAIRASHIAFLANQKFDSLNVWPPERILPIYIRPSEAEMLVGPPEGGPPLAERIQPDGTILPEPPS